MEVDLNQLANSPNMQLLSYAVEKSKDNQLFTASEARETLGDSVENIDEWLPSYCDRIQIGHSTHW